MSRKISVGVAILEQHAKDPEGIIRSIDGVLAHMFREARPVYISLPTDLVNYPVSSTPLQKPLDTSHPLNDKDAQESCLEAITAKVDQAKDPIIIVDACAIRHDVLTEVHNLIDASGLSVFVTPMGKSAVDEGHPQFGGVSNLASTKFL